ncbi:hypothetical protein Bhyg_05689 [Pseudolycoriella hygida]|uniref:Uncharacterized protein n=1 Tax=Pseudolycoriella hygida TaxID=35572 RepID=A0A9Q0N0K8_9DIPT|nr:hypothetical protein Bhyg_05689 [Pseudolycoriella hygida]
MFSFRNTLPMNERENGKENEKQYPTTPTNQFTNGSNGFTSNSNATAFSTVAAKESKPRKHQRDKNLSKLAAMSRRLETSSNMLNEIDRIGGIGTTPFIPNLYQHHLPEHQHNPINFNQTNSRFHDESSPSNAISNWHAADQSTPTYNRMIGPFGTRPHHRKKNLTPEPQVSPTPHSIRPPSQPNTTKDYQKIANGVLESDFIPSKKRRKNKPDNEDSLSSREELQNITPLPGFQQAFGSTEIGRFSEVFFNAPESPFELRKTGLNLLICFTFIVALYYLISSNSVRDQRSSTLKRGPSSPIARTELQISLPLMNNIHTENQTAIRSFKEIFLAFPWKEFEEAAARNLKPQRQKYTKLFIDELSYFIELEPLVPINVKCLPPPLPLFDDINCSLYPLAFNGVKRNDSLKIGALLQFGFDVDVLEIHMNELYGVVDIFFIIESSHAHYGNIKKPLIWEHVQRQQRFLKFPVVHFVIDDAESLQANDKRWSMEQLQERQRWKKFLDWNEQTKYFRDEDVIGFGDADEIPNRMKLNMFKYCEMKQMSVDFGIWFPFGRINQTYKSDFPVRGHPFTLGDPTYYTLASAKAIAAKKQGSYPSRNRGHSINYMLGGMHMTHYGYLPYQLIKYSTASESNLETLHDVQKLSKYLKAGDVITMEVDFAEIPTKLKNRIKQVDLSNNEMKEICILPWFYDCNRSRYPVWEGGHDTRLGEISNTTMEAEASGFT